jgi:hypothetical protein
MRGGLGFTFVTTGAPAGGSGPVVASVGAVTTGSDTTAEVSAPSGVASGDFLVIVFVCENNNNLASSPTGWTQRLSTSSSFGATRVVMLTRTADGTADDTPVLSISGAVAVGWQTVMLRITGHDGYDTAATGNANSGSSITVPSITTGKNNNLLVCGVMTASADLTTGPSGWTTEVQSEPAQNTMLVFSKVIPSAGSYSGDTVTVSASGQWSIGVVSVNSA